MNSTSTSYLSRIYTHRPEESQVITWARRIAATVLVLPFVLALIADLGVNIASYLKSPKQLVNKPSDNPQHKKDSDLEQPATEPAKKPVQPQPQNKVPTQPQAPKKTEPSSPPEPLHTASSNSSRRQSVSENWGGKDEKHVTGDHTLDEDGLNALIPSTPPQ